MPSSSANFVTPPAEAMSALDSSLVMDQESTRSVYSKSNTSCTLSLHNPCTVLRMADPVTTYALELAQKRGWNQVQFAERIDQTKQTVTMWLSRGMHPKHHTKVAKLFGITVEELQTGKSSNGPREPAQTIYGLTLTPEAAHYAAEWMRLRAPLRAQLQAIVQTLLQDSAGDERQESQVDRPVLQRRQSR
jgi:transcriptional regulator with XRE-family HTH domain